jgi:hypothetical protein
VILDVGHQGHLFLYFFTHFVLGSFCCFCSYIGLLLKFLYTTKHGKLPAQNALFFCFTVSYSFGWTLAK